MVIYVSTNGGKNKLRNKMLDSAGWWSMLRHTEGLAPELPGWNITLRRSPLLGFLLPPLRCDACTLIPGMKIAANPNTYLRGKQEDQVRLWLGRCLVNCSMPLRGKGPVIFIPLPPTGDLPPSHTLCLLRAWVFLRREGRLHSASISEWQRILKGISQYLWFTYKNVSYILSQLLTNSMCLATKTENRNIWDCGYLIPICSEWTSKLPAFSKYESSTLIIACEWGKIIILPLVF